MYPFVCTIAYLNCTGDYGPAQFVAMVILQGPISLWFFDHLMLWTRKKNPVYFLCCNPSKNCSKAVGNITRSP
jgi:hypothetical protein